MVTGIVVALLGTDLGSGKFQVEEHIFCGFRNQIKRPIMNDDSYVIFISGLDFVNYQHYLISMQTLIHKLSGVLGDIEYISNIVRIIIAGNSIRSVAQKHKPTISMTSRVTACQDTIEAVKSFDAFISHLCQYIDIDVMPGENDPTNHILPQKQMHYCMFPESSVFNTFNLVPNPYCCSLNGIKMIGTSGQPVRDIMWYSEIKEPLEAMENCLKWNHLAPTAPDTLGCFPYYDKDPFVIEECPDVFFVGNQHSFGTKVAKGQVKNKKKFKTSLMQLLF